jgi:hypothetical protein
MWRILLLLSIIPIVVTLAARWWFGLRVLAQEGGRACHCDLKNWLPAPDDQAVIHRAEETANEFGKQLRLKALADWRERDPKAAAARESTRRFGMAVPPLSGIIAIFAIIVAKIPIIGACAVFLSATAIAAVLGVLSLAPELRAIAQAVRKSREAKSFPRRDEEDAVARCAMAHAWKETLPPILSLIQR